MISAVGVRNIVENQVDFTKSPERDNAKLCSLLTEYEMFKLLEKLDVKTDITEVCKCDDKPLEEIKTEILTDETAAAFTKSYFTFDGESLKVFCDNTVYTPLMNNTIDIYFESSGQKLCFDAKTAYKYCFENGIEMKNLTFSADLAGYLLNSQSADYTIENLCMTYKTPYRADMGENADIASLEALCTALELEIKKTSMEELLYEIEAAAKFKATGIINNSNLGVETTAQTVINSLEFARAVSEKSGLPIVFTTAPKTCEDELLKSIDTPVKLVDIYVKPIWDM